MILANGESLVSLAVPTALLEQSRDILKRRFSSIVHKRVYTLEFDRYYLSSKLFFEIPGDLHVLYSQVM